MRWKLHLLWMIIKKKIFLVWIKFPSTAPNSSPINPTACKSGPIFETANVNGDIVINRDHLLYTEIAEFLWEEESRLSCFNSELIWDHLVCLSRDVQHN